MSPTELIDRSLREAEAKGFSAAVVWISRRLMEPGMPWGAKKFADACAEEFATRYADVLGKEADQPMKSSTAFVERLRQEQDVFREFLGPMGLEITERDTALLVIGRFYQFIRLSMGQTDADCQDPIKCARVIRDLVDHIREDPPCDPE